MDGIIGVAARPFPGIDNGYLTGYRVRFDEAGPNGDARTSTLLRYAQDVAWRHSEDLGFDREWYRARGFGWVVRGVELEVHAPIPMGHTLGRQHRGGRPSADLGPAARRSADSPTGRSRHGSRRTGCCSTGATGSCGSRTTSASSS